MSSVCKKIKLSETIKWKPILADEYLNTNFQLKKFVIADIKEPQKISKIVHKLQESYPNYHTKFKRIRKLDQDKKFQIILCEKESFSGLSSELEEILCNMTDKDLPVDDILTRKQFEIVSKKYWPINFHLNKHIESLLDNSFMKNESEMLKHDFYIRLILDLTKFKKSNSGVLIVDPRSDILIASGIDQRNSHPLSHSVINAIDNVSKRHIKELKNSDEHYQDHIEEYINSKYKDSQTQSLEFRNFIKKINEKDYLCTNYVAYMTHEPCSMCAMALIHSRINKVYFIFNTKFGYLNTKCKLHCHANLNHNYEVYQAVDFESDSQCKFYFLNEDTRHPELLIKN
ncbi:unnamed protein product [Brachionus calyciflorus]|uniref:CMP/dCMP-type deaminase domain-containing protein n=1 Tax=Brachionus calyciflorus TaxID=104777 RepID=A0A813W3M5_9BILA|nr:unnamed protein product [Brachionus calyciflorus]